MGRIGIEISEIQLSKVPHRSVCHYRLIERAADLGDYLTGNFFASDKSALSDIRVQWPPWNRAWSRAFLGNLKPAQLPSSVMLQSKQMLPQWALDLRNLFQDLEDHFDRVETNFHRDQQNPTVLAKSLVGPIATFACKRLSQDIPARHRAIFSRAAEKSLVEWLEERLTDAVKRCVDLHFRAFVAVACCSRGKSEIAELAKEYARPCAKRLFQVIEANPPLGKILIVLVQQWVTAVSELLDRLMRDREILATSFRLGEATEKVTRLRIGLSDPKAGGRSVAELTFTGGRKLIYKPRDVAGEVAWFSLLGWANKRGWKPSFRLLRTVARDGYGWLESISPLSCHARSEVRRFFYRSGGLLCLMHLAGTTDCHQENIIAVGAHPVLVDAETLGTFANDRMSPGALHTSGTIFRTGYLPVPAEIDPVAFDYSWSALDPVLEPGRTNIHLPTLGRRSQTSRNFAPDIMEGFVSMTNFLLLNRADRQLRNHLSKILTDHPRRLLYRNTRNYVQMIEASLCPDAMHSGIGRSAKLMGLIWRKNIDPAIARQELFALSRLDIPSFARSASLSNGRSAAAQPRTDEILAKLPTQVDLLRLALSTR